MYKITSRIFYVSCVLFFLAFAGAAGAFLFVMHNKCVDFSALEKYDTGIPTILLDVHGNEWARFQLDKRDPVSYEKLPEHLVQAFIAAEDWKFFEHCGISFKGIVRSLLVNLYHGKRLQGASTITQQLVKMLFFDARKTVERKIKEQLFAVLVELQFSKEHIFQTYVNHVYFGCGIYGVQAASQRFWGKNVADVTIDEAAMLAAIVCSPGNYSPLLNPLSACKRRNIILRKMAHLGFITPEQCAHFTATEFVLASKQEAALAPHLKETLRQFLEKEFGRDVLYTGGLVVQTTLDSEIQRHAQQAFETEHAQLQKKISEQVDGGLISLDPKTGAVRALIGGAQFSRSQFNRALQARRQIGSTLKPLIYAAAIDQGKSFADVVVDEPLSMQDHGRLWEPRNFNRKFNGPITRAYGLSCSSNIVAIKTLLEVGYDPVIALAKKCQLTGPFNAYPSLALGCVDATLYEVIGMFNIFANNGMYVQPHYVAWVKDKWGNKLWRHTPVQHPVLERRTVGKVAKVLSYGIERARHIFPDEWIESEAISKTGTTNDSRTCWFVGATPTLTTAVYIGRDDNESLGKNVFPLRTAFPIWLHLNSKLSCAQKKFMYDTSLTEVSVDNRTGRQLACAPKHEAMTIFV